jgi:hypothetical protein
MICLFYSVIFQYDINFKILSLIHNIYNSDFIFMSNLVLHVYYFYIKLVIKNMLYHLYLYCSNSQYFNIIINISLILNLI